MNVAHLLHNFSNPNQWSEITHGKKSHVFSVYYTAIHYKCERAHATYVSVHIERYIKSAERKKKTKKLNEYLCSIDAGGSNCAR